MNQALRAHLPSPDLHLGIPGFRFADLHDAARGADVDFVRFRDAVLAVTLIGRSHRIPLRTLIGAHHSRSARRIDRRSFLKFGERLWQLAFLAQLLAAVHRLGARIKTCVFKGRAVAQVFGLQLVGLAEEIEGRFILLASLGVPSFFVEIFSLVGE